MRAPRKKRDLFPSDPPIGPFGLVRSESSMDKPNAHRRVDYRERTTASNYVERDFPIFRDRFLRWFTPEHYARNRGLYYHKKDKRWYPVIDTKSSNPFRRYKFIKTYYRKKRFYTSSDLKEVKPYRRYVIDLTSAGSIAVGDIDLDSSLTFKVNPEQRLLWYQAWIYILSYSDTMDPLTYKGSHEWWSTSDGELETAEIFSIYKPTSDVDDRSIDEYFYDNRVDAFKAYDSSSLLHDEESGLISHYDHPPYENYNRELRPYTYTGLFTQTDYEGNVEFLSYREINEYLISLGLQPEGMTTSLVGITGSKFLHEHLPWLYLECDSFKYDESMITKGYASEAIPFLDLVGVMGYHRFKREPLRGLPALNQFLGEMPETVKSFADILRSAIKICKALKRRDFESAIREIEIGKKFLSSRTVSLVDVAKLGGSIDLFWKFGIKPFLDDLQAISDAGITFGDFGLSGCRRRMRLDWQKMPWANEYITKEYSFPFEVSHGGLSFKGTSNISLRLTCDTEYGATIRVKDPFNFFIEAMGLNSILGTAWELLPLSFVIDWFVDVGSVIETVTDIDLNSFDLTNGYITYVTRGEATERLSITEIDGKPVNKALTNKYQLTEVSRGFYDPRAKISFNNASDTTEVLSLAEKFILLDLLKPTSTWNLSTSKLGTLAELIIQRVRS